MVAVTWSVMRTMSMMTTPTMSSTILLTNHGRSNERGTRYIADQALAISPATTAAARALVLFNHGQLVLLQLRIVLVVVRVMIWRALVRGHARGVARR